VLANQVRSRLRLTGTDVHRYVSDFRDVPGMSADRVMRVLRGETTATYADLAFWCRQFPEITTSITDVISSWVPKVRPAVEVAAPEPTRAVSRIQPQRPPMR